jgi:drug/metabolite transporter (DMT)-like permease
MEAEQSDRGRQRHAVIQAVLSASFFGATVPLSKLFLEDAGPLQVSGLLYSGGGMTLLVWTVLLYLGGRIPADQWIRRIDLPWLSGAVLAGGVAAPAVLMIALTITPAATASLLLTTEGIATALLAALFFSEQIRRPVWIGIACITGANLLLSLESEDGWSLSLGALGVVLACLLWGLDNNLTRRVAARNPQMIGAVKGSIAGGSALLLSWIVHEPTASPLATGALLLIGAICYGLSIVLFISAVGTLGASRTAAFFGTGPFAGALVSFLLFQTAPTLQLLIALPLLIGGTLLIAGVHRTPARSG